MRIVKIQCCDESKAVEAKGNLDRINVKSVRLDSAIVALSNMHNKNAISSIISNSGSHEVKPTQFDVDELNS